MRKSLPALLFFSLFLSVSPLSSSEDQKNIEKYLELYAKHSEALGPIGDSKKGEIELILDFPTLEHIQAKECKKIGIVEEDPHWYWIRDGVRLPSGQFTYYNRFLSRKGLDGPAGVVVLAITPEQQILVNLIYRHATRSWEIELPRGGRNRGESSEAAARREVKEETGYRVSEILPLGTVASDSGILSNYLRVFFAKVDQYEGTQRDSEETISTIYFLSKDQIFEMFCADQIEIIINEERTPIYCRDAFLAYALLLAEKKGLL